MSQYRYQEYMKHYIKEYPDLIYDFKYFHYVFINKQGNRRTANLLGIAFDVINDVRHSVLTYRNYHKIMVDYINSTFEFVRYNVSDDRYSDYRYKARHPFPHFNPTHYEMIPFVRIYKYLHKNRKIYSHIPKVVDRVGFIDFVYDIMTEVSKVEKNPIFQKIYNHIYVYKNYGF